MTARFRLEVLLVTKINERIETLDAFQPNIAAASAITTVWPAVLDKFFTSKGHAAGAPIARTHEHFRLIKKFHFDRSLFSRRCTRS